MKIAASLVARLEFLSRVTEKECKHLLDTDRRLFGNLFTLEDAQKIEEDPILAERLDAFVSRFGRLQDTVGDKLLPALLSALAETPGPAIDNLDKAEKLVLSNLLMAGWKCVGSETRWSTSTSKIWRFSAVPCAAVMLLYPFLWRRLAAAWLRVIAFFMLTNRIVVESI